MPPADALLPACALLDPDNPDELLVAVAALAHGHAVFLLDGALGRPEDALPDVRRRVRQYVTGLLGEQPAAQGESPSR